MTKGPVMKAIAEGQRERVLSPGRAPRVDGRLQSLLSLGLRSGTFLKSLSPGFLGFALLGFLRLCRPVFPPRPGPWSPSRLSLGWGVRTHTTPGAASAEDVNSTDDCSRVGAWPAQPGFLSAWTATQRLLL